MYQLVAPWPNAAVAAEVEAAFPDGRFASGMPVVVKMVEYNPDDPEWSTEMCQREERTCVKVNGSPWAPQLLWAAHAEACSWFIFEALTPGGVVGAWLGHLSMCVCVRGGSSWLSEETTLMHGVAARWASARDRVQ